MKRVFIAIKVDLSDLFRHVFHLLKNDLAKEKIRWVVEENLHLTLRFLGDVDSTQIEKVIQALDEYCETRNRFSFQLEKLAYFKKQRKPAVIFIDTSIRDKLVEFAHGLDQNLVDIGFPPNPKFTPHLTLGRIKYLKDPEAFYDLLTSMQKTTVQQVDVGQIVFYESILKPEGPIYQVIRKFDLK